MTLDDYLAQFIEGYLLEDLASMASIKLADGKRYGAVGYPMVMTVLSGIEVLGVLTSQARFNPEHGAPRFGEFWQRFVYADRPAVQRLDALVYAFVRHGLAHAFMTKPMIRVTKHHDPTHLCKDAEGILCLDALTFAEEFVASYRQRLRPQIVGDLKATMERRFAEMRAAYWQDRDDKKHEPDKVPLARTWDGATVATQVNSPSAY